MNLNTIYKTSIIYGILILGLSVSLSGAEAALSFSATPTDGGNSIRFGVVNLPTAVNAEVRIRITSSDNQQYQVFQRIQEPFVNDRGERLDRQIVMASGLIGSNASGTLYLQDVERLSYSDQLIYTSNPTGLSDSFTLIYHINSDEIKKSGSFFGKIIYILRPVGGGNQKEIVLNAFLDSYDDDLKIDLKKTSGNDLITLSSESDFKTEDVIEFKFSGHSGRTLRIYQELKQFPTNEDGRLLDKESLQFFVRGGDNGETDFYQPGSLERRRVLLYETEAREDIFTLHFKIDEQGQQNQIAGLYRGNLNFIVESDKLNQVYPYEMEIDIKPVFELTTEYPSGGVSFKGFLPDSPPQTKEVIVSVHTNLGKPYEVIQNVSAPMTNEEGKMIDREYFTIKSELLDGSSGRIQIDDHKSVRTGDSTLFMSDKDGSPAKFLVEYRLRPYMKMPAGHYRTAVVYSLNEI